MLTHSGHLFLIDFGIARQFKPGKARDTIPFGSPGYAAPEQYGKAQTTTRSDIYSLGAILHQLLSGDDPTHHPFTFAPLDTQLPNKAELAELIQKMVAINSEDRPDNIKTIKKELQRFSNKHYSQGLAAYQNHTPPRPGSRSYVPPYNPSNPSTQPFVASSGQQQSVRQQLQIQQAFFAPNPQALISLLCGLIAIFLPLLVIFLNTVLPIYYGIAVVIGLLSLIPSLLGIIFGHIGKRKCKKQPEYAAHP